MGIVKHTNSGRGHLPRLDPHDTLGGRAQAASRARSEQRRSIAASSSGAGEREEKRVFNFGFFVHFLQHRPIDFLLFRMRVEMTFPVPLLIGMAFGCVFLLLFSPISFYTAVAVMAALVLIWKTVPR